MVRLDRIYTGGGDAGETSLVGGARVSKASLRIEAVGAVDELNAALGVCLPELGAELKPLVLRLQNELFDLGADLATPMDKAGSVLRITERQAERLESEIDRLNDPLPALTSFILPGGGRAGAALHMARTLCRRAERACVALGGEEGINPLVLVYLNRLSDLLFVAARSAAGEQEILWCPGTDRD